MGFIITLIFVGLVLIFAEILLVPGVGIAGVLGLLSMGGSCFYAFSEFGTTTGIIVSVVNAVLIVALTIWVLRAKTWKRMSLETNIDSKAARAASGLSATHTSWQRVRARPLPDLLRWDLPDSETMWLR